MKKTALALSTIAILLGGCDPVSERDCGVFDHPGLSIWQADAAPGTTVQFMNDEGTIIEFARQAVELNAPFLGTDGSSNDEDVVCELSARVELRASDDSLSITSTYLQQEQSLLEASDEALFVNHVVQAPVGNELQGGYLADISIDRIRLNINPGRVVYLEQVEGDEQEQLTEEIGGQVYEDVVRIDALELTQATEGIDNPSIDVLQQIVMARQFGVVAFTDAQGLEFVLVPAP